MSVVSVERDLRGLGTTRKVPLGEILTAQQNAQHSGKKTDAVTNAIVCMSYLVGYIKRIWQKRNRDTKGERT